MTLLDLLGHPYVLLTARCLVAGVLVSAGAAKAFDRAAFVQVVKDYQILPKPFAEPLGQALPYAEVAIGISLFVGLALRYAAIAATVMFASFMIAMGINLVRGRRLDCHCFGNAGSGRIGFPSILRSFLLAMLAGDIFLNGNGYLSLDAFLAGSSATITELLAIWSLVVAVFLCYALLKAAGLVTWRQWRGETND